MLAITVTQSATSIDLEFDASYRTLRLSDVDAATLVKTLREALASRRVGWDVYFIHRPGPDTLNACRQVALCLRQDFTNGIPEYLLRNLDMLKMALRNPDMALAIASIASRVGSTVTFVDTLAALTEAGIMVHNVDGAAILNFLGWLDSVDG